MSQTGLQIPSPRIYQAGYKIGEVADELLIPRSTFANYVEGYRPIPHTCLENVARIIGCDVHEFVITHTAPSQTQVPSPLDNNRQEESLIPVQSTVSDEVILSQAL